MLSLRGVGGNSFKPFIRSEIVIVMKKKSNVEFRSFLYGNSLAFINHRQLTMQCIISALCDNVNLNILADDEQHFMTIENTPNRTFFSC